MHSSIIRLSLSTVSEVRIGQDDEVAVRFGPAGVIKSQGIAGVDASTRWTQAGELLIRDAEVSGASLAWPAPIDAGTLEVGPFRYVDMIPIPLDELGYACLRLRIGDDELVVTGLNPLLRMQDVPKYVEHILETQPNQHGETRRAER